MDEPHQPLKAGLLFCLRAVLTLLRWSLWLVLGLLIAVQVYIASTNSLEVPGFILRALEQRLAASGAGITFGHATFDPSGHILIENVKLSTASFPEPIITARAVYGTIDPWAILEGKFEPKNLKLTGVSVFIPAMLSASGRPEEALQDLDAGINLGPNDVSIDYLTGKLGNVSVSAHGTLHTGSLTEQGAGALPLTQFLAVNYPALSRQLASAITELSALDNPQVHAELVASNTRGALVRVSMIAAGFRLKSPLALQAGPLRIVTRFPLLGSGAVQAPIELTMRSLAGPLGLTGNTIHARIRGTLQPAQLTYLAREIEVTVGSASNDTFRARALSTDIQLSNNLPIGGQISAWIAGDPVWVAGTVDLAQQSAQLDLQSSITRPLIAGASRMLGKDYTAFVDPVDPIQLKGRLRLDPGWAFGSFQGSISAGRAHVHGVTLSGAKGNLDVTREHLNANEIGLALFDDEASGTYGWDFATNHFRYLLKGKLRPMDIAGWFGKWWPPLFANFQFPEAPPEASADAQGNYANNDEATTFVYVASHHPVVRSVPLDYARARLFIRPYFTDGVEILAQRDGHEIRGTFRKYADPATTQWDVLDFNLHSTLPLDIPIKIIGPFAQDLLSPYGFDRPPTVDLVGHVSNALSPAGNHQHWTVNADSNGVFRLFGFPIDRVNALTTIDDDKIAVTGIKADFAGGAVVGTTTLTGRGKDQTLAFDAKLTNASLAQAITVVYGFDALKNGRPHPPTSQFVKDRANVRFDFSGNASGKLSDISTFSGFGSALVQGAELANVQMLGQLSTVLKVASLRFTTARANFSVEGDRLVFPDIQVRGANSAIQAQGSYTMDRHSLDFNAKIYPFQQSNSVVKKGLGFLVSPLFAASEMKLTGTIDNPRWNLAISPFNLFRSSESGKPSPKVTPMPVTTPVPLPLDSLLPSIP